MRSQNEHTFYKKSVGSNATLLVCLYVDDIIYMSTSQDLIEDFKSDMKNTFEMSNLGVLNYFLGLEVKQERDGIFVTQKKYVEDLLEEFNLIHCKAAATPMATKDNS